MRKGITKQHKEIVEYINRQRKEGYKDGRIRTLMEVHGHTPENLNLYFQLADEQMRSNTVLQSVFSLLIIVVILGALFVTAQQSGMTAAIVTTLTGAAPWSSWSWSGFGSSYDCGDDYPADADEVMDLSSCVADEEETADYLFCYVNNSVDTDDISPSGVNDEWYSTNVDEDISAISSIDTVALLESSIVFPWTASYDNVDCFSWNHGTVRTEDWHLCNATTASTDTPANMVFYYTDVANGTNVSYGGVSTELSLNSSYYLCYDELSCETSTTACDEEAGEYCVGRLDSESGSSWYPCDTTLDASYYRCCTGGCDSVEMVCGEKIQSQDGRDEMSFDECSSDGTSGCCDESTDCVYNAECYDEDEEITYTYTSLGASTGTGVDIESTTGEYTFVCSDAHWCPKGFEYDSRDNICQPTQAACYDASFSDYCNYIFGTDDMDDWEADTGGSVGCIEPDIDSGGTIYNESCVYSGTYGGVDYYFLQDITWY